jgi:hypothetical protein
VAKLPKRAALDAEVFARRYVELVDQLVKQGVSEPIARQEARLAAIDLLIEDKQEAERNGDPCPLCGRGGG